MDVDGLAMVAGSHDFQFHNTNPMRSSLYCLAMLATFSVGCGSDNPAAPKDQELDRARAATTRYATLSAALADGYEDINVVMSGMGRHYMKKALVDDRFEVDKPEILVYATIGGTEQLVAVEYAVPLDKSVAAPTGFTGDDDVWDHNTGFGLWLVHAWVHLDNPNGVFKPLNSRVP
jgi:hypothetical protein